MGVYRLCNHVVVRDAPVFELGLFGQFSYLERPFSPLKADGSV